MHLVHPTKTLLTQCTIVCLCLLLSCPLRRCSSHLRPYLLLYPSIRHLNLALSMRLKGATEAAILGRAFNPANKNETSA
ncbi:hypothetical protein EDD18DRAFT_1173498 [Armillaria luteobubalina]|uniref:Uncharacterized protein n=1 Tax=Armillaria luteobubalina TaxID=153913 RepID=A0AA39TMM9_9AGAR|nr:hypothetical protein EDD18DRAFT_1173498 [Armillaria luteobubalina]